MAPRTNPLKLNPLQLRTLALLQELATLPEYATPVPESGGARLSQLPGAHGDHFHVGHKVVASRDATGLRNASVWAALERKGLVEGQFPYSVAITKEGLAYDTSGAGHILHGGDH